ncbi:MAG TPA: hypothetical protein VEY33_02755 [Gemmatimonadota bacterium]|nr:hypothetical protein [Gemmatimonadota bacterium]
MPKGGVLLACGLLIACGALTTCGGEEAPPLALGQPIPIGAYALTVQRVQPVPRPGPAISSFREQPGREGVMVFVKWSGLDVLDPMSRIVFTEKYLEDRLSVVDSMGERHEPTTAMQSALLFMNDPGDNWRDWIVLFHLPEESGGWMLEVENPEPAEGQPGHFAVVLGP